MDGDDEVLGNMRSPTHKDAVLFWIWHLISWTFYILLTIVYIPYALAMHLVILALLVITLPALCWRVPRKVHLYAYVVIIMVPGKFLWYNLFRYNRRKGQVWDYEMGKPTPVNVKQRRRLSVAEKTDPQLESPLFTRLPPEIRLKIYEHTILGESRWLEIVGWMGQEPAKVKDVKIRAHACRLPDAAIEDDDEASLKDDILVRWRKLHQVAMSQTAQAYAPHLQMGLPLLQSCKQIYSEAINLFYTLPTFSFRHLHRPPYFLRTVLPHRLALIRSMHILYDQTDMATRSNHVACSTAKFYHKMGQCPFCNPIHWFSGIKQYMTGLQEVWVFIFMKKDQRIPDMGKPWIARMLDLQIGPNGLRDMHIDVIPNFPVEDLGRDLLLDEEEYVTKVKKFKEQLEQRLNKGVERYTAERRLLSELPIVANAVNGQLSEKPRKIHEQHAPPAEMVDLEVG